MKLSAIFVFIIIVMVFASEAYSYQTTWIENAEYEKCNLLSSGDYQFNIGEDMYLSDGNKYTVIKKTTIERKEYTLITYCVRVIWI